MKTILRVAAVVACMLGLAGQAHAQWQIPANSVPVGKGAGIIGFAAAGPCAASVPLVGAGASSPPNCYGSGALGYFATGTDASHLTGIIPYASLSPIASGQFVANASGGTTTPAGASLYQMLSTICGTTTQGSVVAIAASSAVSCDPVFVWAQNYKAAGSTQATTGTITSGQATLSLTSALDFKNGQGIIVDGAGTAYSTGAPNTLAVQPCSFDTGTSISTCPGGTGATAYAYTVACGGANRGMRAALTQVAIANGNATLSQTNYNKITWTMNGNKWCAVYGNHSGSLALIGFSIDGTFWDRGAGTRTGPHWIPAAPPGADVPNWLKTTIVSGGGTTSLTLAANASTSAATQPVNHDDTVALQALVNAGNFAMITKAGTYPLTGTVTIPSNTYVTLAAGVIVQQQIEDTPTLASQVDGSNVNLYGNGGTVQGAGGYQASWSGSSGHLDRAVDLTGCSYCTVKNATLQGSSQAQVAITGGSGIVLDSLRLVGTNGVANVIPSQAIQLSDNIQTGLYITNVSHGAADSLRVSNIDVSYAAQLVLREQEVTTLPIGASTWTGINAHDNVGQHSAYFQAGRDVIAGWQCTNIALACIKFQAGSTAQNIFGFIATGVHAYSIGSDMFEVLAVGGGGTVADVYLQGVGKSVGRGLALNAGVGSISTLHADIIADTTLQEGLLFSGSGGMSEIDVRGHIINAALDCALVTATTVTTLRVWPEFSGCNTSNTAGDGGFRVASASATVSLFDPRISDSGGHMVNAIANLTGGASVRVKGTATLSNSTGFCVDSTAAISEWPVNAVLSSCTSGSFSNVANVAAQLPDGTTAAGQTVTAESAAPSSPASGKGSQWVDSTDHRLHDKNASGVVATTVIPDTGASNNFLTAISSAGAISKAQPSTASLSDYSTGTWTPALTTSGTVGTPTYTAQVGSYERVGRQVTARFTLFVSAWSGSPTGNISITGLPVVSANVANDNGQCSFSLFSISATVSWMGGIISPGTTQITPYQTAGAGASTPSQLTAANLGATPNLYGVCNYHT